MTSLPASTPPDAFDLLHMDRQIQQRETRRRLTKAIGWTSLVAVSITRGGVLGWLLASGGMYGLVRELLEWSDNRPEWRKHTGRAEHGVVGRLLTRRGADALDNPSRFSFPASDPPAGAPH